MNVTSVGMKTAAMACRGMKALVPQASPKTASEAPRFGGLVLSRQYGQETYIGDSIVMSPLERLRDGRIRYSIVAPATDTITIRGDIHFTPVKVGNTRAKFNFEVPADVDVLRHEAQDP